MTIAGWSQALCTAGIVSVGIALLGPDVAQAQTPSGTSEPTASTPSSSMNQPSPLSPSDQGSESPSPNLPQETEGTGPPTAEARFLPLRFKANFGFGFYEPREVQKYISSKGPELAGATPLMSFDVSAAYFFAHFLGIRPTLAYYLASNAVQVDWFESKQYWLHSLAPGLAFDFVIDRGELARFFVSPGVAYQYAWFEGYGARGFGLELALGAELSFGQRRAKGISLALVLRKASLDVSDRPPYPASNVPPINTLDLSSVMLRIGFQGSFLGAAGG